LYLDAKHRFRAASWPWCTALPAGDDLADLLRVKGLSLSEAERAYALAWEISHVTIPSRKLGGISRIARVIS
jgi:hypothetical protein